MGTDEECRRAPEPSLDIFNRVTSSKNNVRHKQQHQQRATRSTDQEANELFFSWLSDWPLNWFLYSLWIFLCVVCVVVCASLFVFACARLFFWRLFCKRMFPDWYEKKRRRANAQNQQQGKERF